MKLTGRQRPKKLYTITCLTGRPKWRRKFQQGLCRNALTWYSVRQDRLLDFRHLGFHYK